MNVIVLLVVFAAGYAASIYSWPKVHLWIVGVETAVRSLEERIKVIKAKI